MKELPIELQGKGQQSDFIFNQIKRNDKYAIYKKSASYKTYYEVFEIRKQKESEFNGIKYEEKELMPNDNMFGINAFCFTDFDKAIDKYNELCQRN